MLTSSAGVATTPRSPRPMSLQASARSARWTAARPPTKTPSATAELDSAPARSGPIQCATSQPHDADTVASNTGMARRDADPEGRRPPRGVDEEDSTRQGRSRCTQCPLRRRRGRGAAAGEAAASPGCQRQSRAGGPRRNRSPRGSPRAPPRSVRRTTWRSTPAGSPRRPRPI